MRAAFALVVVASVLAAVVPVSADHGLFFPVLTVDPDSLKRLLDEGRPIVAVDLRPSTLHADGRLPGARSLPFPDLERRADELPTTGLVVLYCACPFQEINRAYQLLRRRKHDNVFVLEEGFGGWVARGFPVER
jgi:rhodanese-related sulfurtransferase